MILRLENVCKNYGSEKFKILVIKNISYEFRSGNIYTISGRKYAGKTVLMNLIGGIETITSGLLTIDNVSYFSKNKIIKKMRNKYFCYLSNNFNKEYDVKHNIIKNIRGKSNIEDKYNNVLEYVGISSKRNLDISNLSEIDRVRIVLARGLITDAKIILIDEIFDNLSSSNKIKTMELLRKIANDDRIIIISSNSKIIMDKSDEVVNIVTGRIKNNILQK